MKIQSLCIALSLLPLACAADTGTMTADSDPFTAGAAQPNGNGLSGAGAPAVVSSTATPGAAGSAVCEAKTVGNGRVVPDMLIVLDRSGSMRDGLVNRWDPSVSALKTITAQLGSTIDFGLMTFPGSSGATTAPAPTQDCNALTDIVDQLACLTTSVVGTIPGLDFCGPGTVDVPIMRNSGAAIAAALDRMSPLGATPTAATLQAAHAALGSRVAGPDDVVPAGYVLLVTDGAPNCSTDITDGVAGLGGALGGIAGFDQGAVDQSVSEIQAMAKDGIKTYVIGYNTKSDPQLSAALDRMAQSGDTGDQRHHAIEDGNTLVAELGKIAGAAASCEFVLSMQPLNATYVEVKLDDMSLKLDDANGWQLSADRRRVALQGSACAAIAGKEQHVLSVRVLCEPVVLQ